MRNLSRFDRYLFRHRDDRLRQVFETKGVGIIDAALASKTLLIMMDELGRIEIAAPKFQETVFKALDSEIPSSACLSANQRFPQCRCKMYYWCWM